MTKREFIIQHKAFEKGMIQAWKHIIALANGCVKAHRGELTKKRVSWTAEKFTSVHKGK